MHKHTRTVATPWSKFTSICMMCLILQYTWRKLYYVTIHFRRVLVYSTAQHPHLVYPITIVTIALKSQLLPRADNGFHQQARLASDGTKLTLLLEPLVWLLWSGVSGSFQPFCRRSLAVSRSVGAVSPGGLPLCAVGHGVNSDRLQDNLNASGWRPGDAFQILSRAGLDVQGWL